MVSPSLPIAVLGTGPAGLLLAAALADRRLPVTLVGPRLAAFEPTYGLFWDEVAGTPLQAAVQVRWPAVEVHTPAAVRTLAESYVRLDSAVAARLLAEATQGCAWVEGRVERVERRGDHLRVLLADGSTLDAHRVVDATGHHPVAVHRTPARHVQIALGATLTGAHGLSRPILMDFTGAHDSFLYALPLTPDALFVEETALVTDSPPSWEQLEGRLRARLERMGLTGSLRVHERCVIPMDPGLPDLDQPVLGFGAAASFVNPATGYQLAACLRRAAPTADALRDTWDQPLDVAVAQVWRAIWPSALRRARPLRTFGAGLLAGLDSAAQARFFDAFFQVPAPWVRAYLADDATVADLCSTMLRVFPRLPPGLRWHVLRHGAASPIPVLRPLLGI